MIDDIDNTAIQEERPQSPPKEVLKDAAEFAHDVVSLSELQVALFREDARRGFHRFVQILSLFLLAAIFTLGAIPVGLLAVAYWLQTAGWSLAVALSMSAALGLLTAIAIGGFGWRLARASESTFTRSKHEFVNNLHWLKQVIAQHRGPTSKN